MTTISDLPRAVHSLVEVPGWFLRMARGDSIEVTHPDGLMWLQRAGVGFMPNFRPEIYGEDYFAKYVVMDRSDMGMALNEHRYRFVRKHFDGPLVDFGIGAGAFLQRCWFHLPDGQAAGFDINPRAVDWLKQRGAWVNPWTHWVRAVTFWDSLEHVPDIEPLLANVTEWAFVSMPIVDSAAQAPTPGWRHYRPGEHLLYTTTRGIVRVMHDQGFELAERARFETDLGRLDIETFAFRRRA